MAQAVRLGEKVFHGIPVSAGVCRGKILVLGKSTQAIPRRTIEAADAPAEIERLEQALVATRHEILQVQQKVTEAMGAKNAGIFDAHLLVLEDPTLIDEVTRLISQKLFNAEAAFHDVAEKYAASLAAAEDEYLS